MTGGTLGDPERERSCGGSEPDLWPVVRRTAPGVACDLDAALAAPYPVHAGTSAGPGTCREARPIAAQVLPSCVGPFRVPVEPLTPSSPRRPAVRRRPGHACERFMRGDRPRNGPRLSPRVAPPPCRSRCHLRETSTDPMGVEPLPTPLADTSPSDNTTAPDLWPHRSTRMGADRWTRTAAIMLRRPEGSANPAGSMTVAGRMPASGSLSASTAAAAFGSRRTTRDEPGG